MANQGSRCFPVRFRFAVVWVIELVTAQIPALAAVGVSVRAVKGQLGLVTQVCRMIAALVRCGPAFSGGCVASAIPDSSGVVVSIGSGSIVRRRETGRFCSCASSGPRRPNSGRNSGMRSLGDNAPRWDTLSSGWRFNQCGMLACPELGFTQCVVWACNQFVARKTFK